MRVTTSVPIASLWLVPNLAQFQEQHPGIAVHVVANNAFNDLNRDGLDLAVRYCTREAAGPDALKLFGETITPVCSPRLLKKTPITSPSDLTRVPLLHFVDLEQRVAWISWDAWFHAAKLHPLKSKGHPQFSLYDQTIAAAVAGQGVALGRQPLINHLIQAGKLVTPFPSRRYRMTSNGRAYWLLTSNRARERKAVQQFTSWLTQV